MSLQDKIEMLKEQLIKLNYSCYQYDYDGTWEYDDSFDIGFTRCASIFLSIEEMKECRNIAWNRYMTDEGYTLEEAYEIKKQTIEDLEAGISYLKENPDATFERFNTLKDDILNDNKKNDIVASMKVINEGTQTKIQLGENEYVLPMSSELAGNHYCFPNAKEPMFALSVNALEGIITVGTKDEKVKQYLLSLKDEGLKITDNGKSVTFQSTYDALTLHHKLMKTLMDSMQLS